MASPAASLDADAVAAYLLDRRHLLSAFELYQDLISPGGAASTKAGERDVVRDGDADARAKLEAFFGDQKRFALSDVRAHAGAVDGAPRDTPRPPNHRSSPPPDGATRRDLTLDPNLTNTLPPTVPTLRATVREQESRIKLAEYERRCAEEDLARLREERETRAVPATPRRSQNAIEGGIVADENAAVVFERVDEAPRDAHTPSYAARDGFLNRAECVDLANVVPIPPTLASNDGTPTAPADLPDMTPGERRCLNLVTHQYLARRGYRAAALAMRQEATAGHDLDDLSPLGGEPARGEALRLMLRRAKALETLDPAAFEKMRRERDDRVRELGDVKTAKETLESELAAATRDVDAVRRELAKARAEYEAAATESERWRAKFDEAAATVRHVERAAERARREPVTHRAMTHRGGSITRVDRRRPREGFVGAGIRGGGGGHDSSAPGIAAEDVAPHARSAPNGAAAPVRAGGDAGEAAFRTRRDPRADVVVREAPGVGAATGGGGDVRVDRRGDGRGEVRRGARDVNREKLRGAQGGGAKAPRRGVPRRLRRGRCRARRGDGVG